MKNCRTFTQTMHPCILLGAWLMVASCIYTQAQTDGWFEGITHPVLDSTLGAPNDGVIGGRYFDEGDAVDKGQVIVELSTEIERLDVERRKVAMNLSEKEWARLKQLTEKTSSVSAERLETAEGNYLIAKADFELAQARLKDRQVIAPFSGVIADFLEHEVGEGTKVGNPLIRLVDTSRILFVCNLPFDVAGHLQKGQKLPIKGAFKDLDKVVTGEITFISPVVDAASGLLRIKVVIDNPERQIRPGVMALVQIN
ncbi:MAG: efflux RND transporter periplasmic adaptor subunit [Verrucomicrobia bacterium]|nr:efflux RND transporter periplasmic adaptor subunit [Verrucomicrobiota bacterium]